MSSRKLFSRQAGRKTVVAALALSLCLGLGACKDNDMYAAPDLVEPVEAALATVVAKNEDVYDLTYYQGAVTPYSEEMMFSVDGELGSVAVLPGDHVKKGDFLAQLNFEGIQEKLEKLNEQLEQLQHSAETENRSLDLSYRQVKSWQAQLEASGAEDYMLELASIDAWEAWMEIEHAEQRQELDQRSVKNEIAALEAELAKRGQLVAPFDGVVGWVNESVTKGTFVEANTPILCIYDPDRVSITTDIVQETTIALSDRIYAKIGAEEYELTPRERSRTDDALNKNDGLRLTTVFDINDYQPGEIEIGMNALVLLRRNNQENVLCVPTEVLFKDTDGYYLYVEENGQIVGRDVEIGIKTKLRTEILSGLEEGDVVYVY